MVAKISHGSNLYGAITYNQEKVEAGQASVIFSQDILFSPDLTYNVKQAVMSFDLHMLMNKRTKKPVVHISLNPDPKEKISDEQAKQIAQKYMVSMGYGSQPYLLYKHEDISRTHYHIVTVNIDENGNKISDKFEKRRSMDICRSIEKEFKLHVPTKKQLFEESLVQQVEYQNGNLLKQIKSVTSQLLETYKITSLNEYKILLELHGMTLTPVDGIIENKPIHGIFYSAIDENLKKTGRQLKSSLLDNNSGYKDLQKKFKNDKKRITEQNKSFIKRVVTQCMYQCKNRSRNELTELLKKRNIALVLHTNEEGRTYGVTFVDHNTKTVINGSGLGKEYSANVLNKFFDNPYYILTEELENKGIENSPTKEKEDWNIPIGGGYDPDEEAWKRKKRKKQKR